MTKRRKRDGSRSGTGTVLGLKTFERISAVEGVRLTAEMRRDLLAFERDRTGPEERTRILAAKYGRENP